MSDPGEQDPTAIPRYHEAAELIAEWAEEGREYSWIIPRLYRLWASGETVITPKMIEAGCQAYRWWDNSDEPDSRVLVRRVLEEALAARRYEYEEGWRDLRMAEALFPLRPHDGTLETCSFNVMQATLQKDYVFNRSARRAEEASRFYQDEGPGMIWSLEIREGGSGGSSPPDMHAGEVIQRAGRLRRLKDALQRVALVAGQKAHRIALRFVPPFV